MPAKKIQKVSARAPRKLWPKHAALIAALWVGTFFAYSNSFDGGLVFDNAAVIGHDPRIRAATAESIGLIFHKEYWYPANNSGLYRPLTTLSYLLNYSALDDGPNPAGYHVVNLLLHDVNVALVYALGVLIFGGAMPAFALAGLWAVHPLLTESVTNIVGRADLLAGFGVLAGLLCHARAASATGRKRIAWLVALAGAQTIGIFSKESAAILPGAMALYDFVFARERCRTRLGNSLINYAVLAIPFAAFFILRMRIDTHLAITPAVNPLVGAGFWTAKITAVKILGKLLWLFCWPARLSVDYSYNAIPLASWRPFDWAALFAVVTCVGLIALAIIFRRNRALLFFIGLVFLALAPTSNLLFPIGTNMAERFMYLPSVALCGALVVAAQAIRGREWIKWTVVGALCLAFATRTYARNFDWHDGVALWSSAVAAYPECARAHYNLGQAWIERSDYQSAVGEFETALRILPDYPHAHLNAGAALEKLPGRSLEAIGHYEAAVKEDPGFADAHYDLGDALARNGRVDEALPELREALRLNPDLAEAHNDLGAIASQMPGRTAEAIAEYQAALRVRPDYVQARKGLGRLYLQLNRAEDAAAQLQTAVQIQPDDAEAHTELGNAFAAIPGRLSDAITQYGDAIRLRPDLGEPHYRMGMALLRMPERAEDALGELETALRIHPDPQGEKMVQELRIRLKR